MSAATRLVRFLIVVAIASMATLAALPAQRASAHNTLLSSDPGDGATLSTPPTQITWFFDKSVPLETLTVTVIDPTGARSEVSGSFHGASGDTEVVTPLPTLPAGAVSLRWRLVGADGHPITGRVDVTISAPTPSAAPATTDPAGTTPTTGATAAPATTTPAAVAPADDSTFGDGSFATPSAVRWILRYVSYLAILAIVGIMLVSAFVWDGAGTHPLLRRTLEQSLFATAALGFAQLLVVASDVTGAPPWASIGSIDAATVTDAGMAFAIRIVLALTLWLVLFRYRVVARDVYWTAVSLPAIGLLGTWAFAGHSRSMRWPVLGVVTDVAHHAAAAAWISGLAVVGWVVIPHVEDGVRRRALHQFSRVAAFSVGVLVVTGLAQSIRLVGGPGRLVDADHGRLLVAKLVVLVAMLVLANANRGRLERQLRNDAATGSAGVGALRETVVAEFAIGLVIIGITAAMVVSPPATADDRAAVNDATPPHAVNYTV